MPTDIKIKLYKKIISIVFLIFLIIFLVLYGSQVTGYYDYEQHQKMVLTEEKIRQFENDVKAGKNLDLNTYLEDQTVNYQNKVSKFGYRVSSTIGKYTKAGIKKTFALLNKILDDE